MVIKPFVVCKEIPYLKINFYLQKLFILFYTAFLQLLQLVYFEV